MLLEDGETWTRGYKNLQMLLEDCETWTCGCKNLEIKNFMYLTPHQLFCEPVFLALHYPRPPCAPSFIKSRTLRILPTHFLFFWNSLYVYTRGILGCLLGFWPLRVTKETLLSSPQTPWHLLKPPINFISWWGDSLTDVGYNFGQVKISTFNTCWNTSVVLLNSIVY